MNLGFFNLKFELLNLTAEKYFEKQVIIVLLLNTDYFLWIFYEVKFFNVIACLVSRYFCRTLFSGCGGLYSGRSRILLGR